MAQNPIVNDAATRERLTPAAVRAFLSLAGTWQLSVPEQVNLLGASVGRSTLQNWARGRHAVLSADQLLRISYLLGIHEGLQRIWRLHPHEAVAWIRRPNLESPFDGMSPIDFALSGGILALSAMRAWIDGATGGPPSRVPEEMAKRGPRALMVAE
ncbi:MAG: DUF2384 domain-containing protein [Gemmatimonadetes bacterium]|nr:DUF2384 domain-containing protein [Gemmatimonadota bacterium]